MTIRSIWAAAALAAIGIVGVASAQPAYTGPSDYEAFCASCHGAAGKGDGPIASTLTKRPADLTRLAQKNNGAFPTDRVVKTVADGAKAHGGAADMPEWISVFTKSSGSAGPGEAQDRIKTLVRYLETLQARP
jgi:cytochrome c553